MAKPTRPGPITRAVNRIVLGKHGEQRDIADGKTPPPKDGAR